MTDVEFKLHYHCAALFGDCFTRLSTEAVGPSSDFAEDFEVIKRNFDGKNLDKIHRLKLQPLKGELEAANLLSPHYDFIEGKILLNGYGKSIVISFEGSLTRMQCADS
jgi:hypothetical protein